MLISGWIFDGKVKGIEKKLDWVLFWLSLSRIVRQDRLDAYAKGIMLTCRKARSREEFLLCGGRTFVVWVVLDQFLKPCR